MAPPIKEQSPSCYARKAAGATCSLLVASQALSATAYAAPITLLSISKVPPQHRLSVLVSAVGAPLAAAGVTSQIARHIWNFETTERNAVVIGTTGGVIAGHYAYQKALKMNFPSTETWAQEKAQYLAHKACEMAEERVRSPSQKQTHQKGFLKRNSLKLATKGANHLLDKVAEEAVKKCTAPLIHGCIRLGARTVVGGSLAMGFSWSARA